MQCQLDRAPFSWLCKKLDEEIGIPAAERLPAPKFLRISRSPPVPAALMMED
jgi:hypothetical protein